MVSTKTHGLFAAHRTYRQVHSRSLASDVCDGTRKPMPYWIKPIRPIEIVSEILWRFMRRHGLRTIDECNALIEVLASRVSLSPSNIIRNLRLEASHGRGHKPVRWNGHRPSLYIWHMPFMHAKKKQRLERMKAAREARINAYNRKLHSKCERLTNDRREIQRTIRQIKEVLK